MPNDIDDAVIGELMTRAAEAYRSNGLDAVTGVIADFGQIAATPTKGPWATTDHQTIIVHKASGERRAIPTTYVAKTLKKHHRDGSKAFEVLYQEKGTGEWHITGPVAEWHEGNLMCFLHPDHPGRDGLLEMGIGPERICGDHETNPAAKLPTEFDLMQHEKSKHPICWKIREDFLEKAEREQEREERRAMTTAMMELARSGRSPQGKAS